MCDYRWGLAQGSREPQDVRRLLENSSADRWVPRPTWRPFLFFLFSSLLLLPSKNLSFLLVSSSSRILAAASSSSAAAAPLPSPNSRTGVRPPRRRIFFSFPRRACTLFSSILFRLCFFGRFFFWLFLVDPGEGGGREARFELLLLMTSMPQLEVKISSYIARLLFFFFFWPCATADREFDDDLCGHLLNFADFICKNIFFLDRSIIIA